MPTRSVPWRYGLSLLAILWVTVSQASTAQEGISPQQLQEDLSTLQGAINRTHPDLRHSTNEAELARAIEALRSRLNQEMTRDEAWKQFATLNPVFADAHLFVGFPDWRAASSAHLTNGGVFFPYEVYLDPAGQPFVRAKLGGASTSLAGARIDRIDGLDARQVTKTLLARVHGDTPAFRSELLSRRWWFYYWKLYGDKTAYDLVLARTPNAIHVPGSRETPVFLADEARFDRQFRFELLPGQCALLTIGTFSWPDEDEYYEFTRKAFAQMRDTGVRTLVIDIRGNGGGDDAFWMKGILGEVATKPYRWGSTYRKRIIEKYRDEGERTGDVVTGTIGTWIQPEPDSSARFTGKTYVLVGPSTYSSAILFSNVMQDFGFGTVAGTGGSARSTQSGGIEPFTLPHTGLVVWSPRFVLVRPSGEARPELFEPDIPLREDPYRPRAAIDALLSRLHTSEGAAH